MLRVPLLPLWPSPQLLALRGLAERQPAPQHSARRWVLRAVLGGAALVSSIPASAVAQGVPQGGGVQSPRASSLTAPVQPPTAHPATVRAGLAATPFVVSPAAPELRRVGAALAAVPAGQATALSAQVPRRVARTALELIAVRRLDPPPAARVLALTHGALHDAAWLAHQSGRVVDTDTAAAVAATRVLMALFGDDGARLARELQAGLLPLPAEVDRASWVLGDAVADAVLTFARQDGAAQAARPGAALPQGEGYWAPLSGQQALEPGWGQVRPVGLGVEDLPRVAPPPGWDSAEFATDRAAFAAQQARLTPADRALAAYWAAGPGTVTPLGLWLQEALRLGEQARLGGGELAQVLAATAVAGHDAFISCWQGKFEYNVARPQGWMAAAQPGWTPPLPTPPFPSYPSGHATVSGAAAEVLARVFPLQARQLRRDAQDAAFSRVVGGIHWSIDGAAGLDVGQRVARALLEKGQP